MPSKRRNNGRSKKNRGHTRPVNCENCGRLSGKVLLSFDLNSELFRAFWCPCECEQDKIIKRFMVKDFFDASTKKDLNDSSAYPSLAGTTGMLMPKLYLKNQYCISCAIHLRVVRVRNSQDRKVRHQRHVRPEARRVSVIFSF